MVYVIPKADRSGSAAVNSAGADPNRLDLLRAGGVSRCAFGNTIESFENQKNNG